METVYRCNALMMRGLKGARLNLNVRLKTRRCTRESLMRISWIIDDIAYDVIVAACACVCCSWGRSGWNENQREEWTIRDGKHKASSASPLHGLKFRLTGQRPREIERNTQSVFTLARVELAPLPSASSDSKEAIIGSLTLSPVVAECSQVWMLVY